MLASIHVIGASLDNVRNCLAACQFDRFYVGEMENLENRLHGNRSSFRRVFEIVKFIRQQKDQIARFYSMVNGNNISVFSDYITFHNVFEIAKNYFEGLNCFVVAFGASDSGALKLEFLQRGQLLLSWDCAAKENADFLALKKTASLFHFSGDEYVFESDLCAHQKLEQYLGLPFSLTWETLDKKSKNVYVDEFIL